MTIDLEKLYEQAKSIIEQAKPDKISYTTKLRTECVLHLFSQLRKTLYFEKGIEPGDYICFYEYDYDENVIKAIPTKEPIPNAECRRIWMRDLEWHVRFPKSILRKILKKLGIPIHHPKPPVGFHVVYDIKQNILYIHPFVMG